MRRLTVIACAGIILFSQPPAGGQVMARHSKHSANHRHLKGGIRGKATKHRGRHIHGHEHTAGPTMPSLTPHPYHTQGSAGPGSRPLTYPE